MAFKALATLDTDITTALGGRNKQTGKANPTEVEGYYLGSKKVESRKAKSGYAFLHVLQTAEGNLGVWGKTDMDRQLPNVKLGTMVRISHTHMQKTPNGDMYKFKVEVDEDNTIEVSGVKDDSYAPSATTSESYNAATASDDESSTDEELFDEAPYVAPVAPKVVAKAPDAARVAKVQAMLAARK